MKKAILWLDENLEEFLLIIFLIGMTVIMGAQIFCRYILEMSLSWSEELTRYLFVWSGFLSVSYCSKKCLSIKIEQFVALFPRRGKAVFKLVNHTFEFIFFVYMIPFAYSYMMSAVKSGQVSPACSIPMYYVQAAPFVWFLSAFFSAGLLDFVLQEAKTSRIRLIRKETHPNRLSKQIQSIQIWKQLRTIQISKQIQTWRFLKCPLHYYLSFL